MIWLWSGIALCLAAPAVMLAGLVALQVYLHRRYLSVIVRIFEERPLFLIPRGRPVAGAEDVRFATGGGLWLRGCYLRTRMPRKGVILFGLEFGSNRWACLPYCEPLVDAGYDVFAYEPRDQGDSDRQPGHEPLQWVSDRDLADARAALKYLATRPDADPKGVGFFGVSKGATAGLLAAASAPEVRCCVTDGAYATYTTVIPYMRKWIAIYDHRKYLHGLLPSWFYGILARSAIRASGRKRGLRFLHLEPMLSRLAGRAVLMIHGGGDTYIKPQMARELYDRLVGTKELWLIDKAKHNQSHQVAGADYHRRVVEFFDRHLAAAKPLAHDDHDPAPELTPGAVVVESK